MFVYFGPIVCNAGNKHIKKNISLRVINHLKLRPRMIFILHYYENKNHDFRVKFTVAVYLTPDFLALIIEPH